MIRTQIEQRIKAILASMLLLEAQDIELDMLLIDELDMNEDSLQEVFNQLEESFDFDFSYSMLIEQNEFGFVFEDYFNEEHILLEVITVEDLIQLVDQQHCNDIF